MQPPAKMMKFCDLVALPFDHPAHKRLTRATDRRCRFIPCERMPATYFEEQYRNFLLDYCSRCDFGTTPHATLHAFFS
jgi:hypothetical protein